MFLVRFQALYWFKNNNKYNADQKQSGYFINYSIKFRGISTVIEAKALKAHEKKKMITGKKQNHT